MSYVEYITTPSDELYHHGIKGQRWGVRRFQNKDGTLTKAGKARYMNSDGSLNDKGKRKLLNRDAEAALNKGEKELNGIAKEAANLMSDYHKNWTDWARTAGVCTAIAQDETTMEDIASMINGYVDDDLDQGYGNSASLYLQMTGKTKQAIDIGRRYYDKLDETKNGISKALGSGKSKLANDIVGRVTDQNVDLWVATEGADPANNAKYSNQFIKEAQKFVKKYAEVDNVNTSAALYRTGLANKNYNEMTTSDWNRLKEEVKRMGRY